MQKLSQEQIEKAVNWWGNVIKDPKFDNGDKSYGGFMAHTLASLAGEKMKPTEEKIEIFKNNLREILNQKEIVSLGVDYGPDLFLSEAAEKSQISDLAFPWKTCMNFRDGKVIVGYGYGSPWKEI